VSREAHLRFDCFGGTVAVHVRGETEADGRRLAEGAQETLLDAHRRLSRFDPESELSRLNRDPRPEVPASSLLRKLAAAVFSAGFRSSGLVDATMVEAIERAGYAGSLDPSVTPTPIAGPGASSPAHPDPEAHWSQVGVDDEAGTVIRPTGVKLDGGGIVKGLLADLVGESLAGCRAYAVDCCGDIRVGGRRGLRRLLRVEDPHGGEPLHELALADGGIATSGITKRVWIGPDGRPAHQILDPATGRPAFTGIVQVTALAPTALPAEILAKTAFLSGPGHAASNLPHGGVVVRADGDVEIVRARGRTRNVRAPA
jgi:thiamine biosynthesis lipoprotein